MLAHRVLSSSVAAASSASLHRARTSPLAFRAFSSSAAAVATDAKQANESIVFTSPHRFIEIPKVTIWDIAQEQAAKNGDHNAFICGLTHQKITFEELCEDAKRVAVALAQDGVRKGDVSDVSLLCAWLIYRFCSVYCTLRI